MDHILRLIAFLLFLATAAPAGAAWLEVESENFVFVGNTKERTARRIIRELEIYRGTVLRIVGIGNVPEQRKVRIFGLNGSHNIEKVTGVDDVAGIYVNGDDYPIFVTNLKGGVQAMRETSYHEFAHHILRAYTTSYYPLWYNEGFAEYLSLFEIEDDGVLIGRPAAGYIGTINGVKWFDIRILLESIGSYPFSSDGSTDEALRLGLFYGLSWLAVHYIQSTPDFNGGLAGYIESLNNGTHPIVAFETNFQMSTAEFEKELREYWRGRKFKMFRIGADWPEPNLVVRRLDKSAAERRLAEIRVEFLPFGDGGRSERNAVRRKLESLIAEYGESLEFTAALAHIAFLEGDRDRAVELAEGALAANPDDTRAIAGLADALFHRRPIGGQPSPEDNLRSRALFAAVLEREPLHPTANNHYPQTFLYAGDTPDQLAYDGVAIDLNFNRNPLNIAEHLNAAELYILGGFPEHSCTLLDKVAGWILGAHARHDEQTEEQRKFHNTRVERLERLQNDAAPSCASEDSADSDS